MNNKKRGFRKIGDLTRESFFELKEIQTGEKRLPKTGFDFIDCHIGGLLPGDVVVISGLAGHGKSETLFRMRDNMLNTDINPEAEDYIWVNFNLEVRSFNVMLRSLSRILNKKKSDILTKEFTKSEKKLVEEYYKKTQDNRQFVCQDNVSAKDFYEISRNFLEKNTDKKAVHISFDHVALVNGLNKQKEIEDLISYANQLKLEFNNVYFYFISQLNRNILSRAEERSNNSAPHAGDIYASSSMDFISSYNIVVFDAYRLGIVEFMKFDPDRYSYLEDYFTLEDKKGRVSFETAGNLFYKVIKSRDSDNHWKDMFIIEKDLTSEEKNRIKEEKKERAFNQVSDEDLPSFLENFVN